MKNFFYSIILCVSIFLLALFVGINNEFKIKNTSYPEVYHNDQMHEDPEKHAEWTPEQAEYHQKVLDELSEISKNFDHSGNKKLSDTLLYADGALKGTWNTRAPKNMPGAFKFAEMLDGTDTMYVVSHNHYAGNYSSKSFIYKGTVYNPSKGTGGDDFKNITPNWPNRYKNLFAFRFEGGVRLVAHIENGPMYFSDDEGETWKRSIGLPKNNMSSAINRQDNHSIYVTNGQDIFKSNDQGESFSLFQSFNKKRNSALYTPRYAQQAKSDKVYLARSGSFYSINDKGTSFILRGDYSDNNHNNDKFSIGGDDRKLYVTADRNFWVSTDGGENWSRKFPHGNYYGNKNGKFWPGYYIAVSPENEDVVVGGYAIPIISLTGLDDVITDKKGWGFYQNGNHLPVNKYHNRIKFNYHPDFQACHFFYNSSGNLFSTRCSDGGIFISYKEWTDIPKKGQGYNNSGYKNAHFINITTLNTPTSLIYRNSMFTGDKNPTHLFYGTQDQGTQNKIPDSDGDLLDVYQSIGGDGPSIDSYDGIHAWKWASGGGWVRAPVSIYKKNGKLKSASEIEKGANQRPKVNFTPHTKISWLKTYIDRKDSGTNLWVLARKLYRATWDGSNLKGHIVDLGKNQVAALAQGLSNPDKLYMLQDSKVFISDNRGDSFKKGVATPFEKTSRNITNYGSGVVLPTNDKWILFCAPSNNKVGAILSKDGGESWVDVTGIFPRGQRVQTGGMVASKDGKYVFAGTHIGPYVFDVETEKWFSIAEGIGFFNSTDVDYIPSINTVRFGTWGSGVIDFKIESDILNNNDIVTDDTDFVLYPNPVVDDFYVSTSSSNSFANLDIRVYSMSGKEIIQKQNLSLAPSSPLKIDMNHLAKGVYIVKIKNEKNETIRNIIKM